MTVFEIVSLHTDAVVAESLKVPPGQRVVLSGDSGSGKTMFLRALADLIPWQGEMRLDNQSVHDMMAHQWRGRVMFLEADSAWWAERVIDHFPDSLAPPLLDLNLDPALLESAPARISSGQRQRMALLRALARRPRVLLLDEPSANLDETNTARLEARLLEWSREGGILIMTSHEARQRQRMGTRFWHVADRQVREKLP